MKIEINYLFDRDTHIMSKEFDKKKSSMFSNVANDYEILTTWLADITRVGFFEAKTEKGTTLVPVRNINFILLKE